MNQTAIDDTLTELATDGCQYLTFMLQDEQFGIDILRVQEIKGYTKVTPIPNMPAFIKGAMDLRGTVVPIVDLRCKFNMPEAEYTQFTVIIVVNVGTKILGLVVDAVSDVLNVGDEDVDATPCLGGGVDTSFIKGMAKAGDQLITLLEIEQLLNLESVRVGAA